MVSPALAFHQLNQACGGVRGLALMERIAIHSSASLLVEPVLTILTAALLPGWEPNSASLSQWRAV